MIPAAQSYAGILKLCFDDLAPGGLEPPIVGITRFRVSRASLPTLTAPFVPNRWVPTFTLKRFLLVNAKNLKKR